MSVEALEDRLPPMTAQSIALQDQLLVLLRRLAKRSPAVAPSNQEIATYLALRSGTSAVRHVEGLERRGLIIVDRYSNGRIIRFDGLELRSERLLATVPKQTRVYTRKPSPPRASKQLKSPVSENGSGERQAEVQSLAVQMPALASPVSTTALIMGDPLPGRSALDRKRAQAAEARSWA